MYVCMHLHICMYVCMYVCKYVYMCMYVCMHESILLLGLFHTQVRVLYINCDSAHA